MGAVVLDTSVLFGLLDDRDPHHAAATRALTNLPSTEKVIIPTSVVSELLVGAMRRGPAAVRTTEAFVDDVADVVHVIDLAVAREAARLRATHRSLRLPDALVLGCAVVVSAERVLTADKRWAAVDPRVEVIGG